MIRRENRISPQSRRALAMLAAIQCWTLPTTVYHQIHPPGLRLRYFLQYAWEVRRMSIPNRSTAISVIGDTHMPGKTHTSKGNPLYSLCFAAANERGGKPAVKIANDILRKFNNG